MVEVGNVVEPLYNDVSEVKLRLVANEGHLGSGPGSFSGALAHLLQGPGTVISTLLFRYQIIQLRRSTSSQFAVEPKL